MINEKIVKYGAIIAVFALVMACCIGSCAAVDEGSCGGGLTWSVDEDKKLTITYDGQGSGIMDDYTYETPSPWGTNITSLSLPEGLKH